MPVGELDTYPAEGAGTQPTFTPPPTEPAPAYFPPTLYPTLGNSQTSLGNSQSLVEAATVRVSQEGGQLTEDEMRAVLYSSGWPEELFSQALAVSWCESRWSPYAHNGGNAGLFQMNITEGATLRGSWFTYWGLPEDRWSDPVVNATAARLTWERSGWSPWSCRP